MENLRGEERSFGFVVYGVVCLLKRREKFKKGELYDEESEKSLR